MKQGKAKAKAASKPSSKGGVAKGKDAHKEGAQKSIKRPAAFEEAAESEPMHWTRRWNFSKRNPTQT